MTLEDKIRDKTAHLGIAGLGYVGLPLAVEFGKSGFSVVGIDPDERKVEMINKGESYVVDIDSKEVKILRDRGILRATSDYSEAEKLDAILIAVPTPLSNTKQLDLSCVINASQDIAEYIHKDQLIILESTTYPGTTEEVVLPILERSGLKAGVDFHLAFSPERIDPGNKKFTLTNTPKVVGGLTKRCRELAQLLYSQIIEEVVPVSSLKVAEMSKLLENTFRSVNIALANEMALLCDRMGIDIWEVVDAASTKPFGFMPFYPGPGVGGHCIPVDPYYLLWKAREYDFHTRFIELAEDINSNMPFYVVSKISQALNSEGKSVKKARILVLGAAFKKDVNDLRNSPSLRVMELLYEQGAEVLYNDPYVPELEINNAKIVRGAGPLRLKSVDLNEDILREVDCVVIAVDHSRYDFAQIVQHSKLIVDAKNATKEVKDSGEKIVKI